MAKPAIQRGSDDWCFMKQDSTNIGSTTYSNTRHTSATYPQHTSIERP